MRLAAILNMDSSTWEHENGFWEPGQSIDVFGHERRTNVSLLQDLWLGTSYSHGYRPYRAGPVFGMRMGQTILQV